VAGLTTYQSNERHREERHKGKKDTRSEWRKVSKWLTLWRAWFQLLLKRKRKQGIHLKISLKTICSAYILITLSYACAGWLSRYSLFPLRSQSRHSMQDFPNQDILEPKLRELRCFRWL
jgi:hypothetical protein